MNAEPTGIALDAWIERVRTALGSTDAGIDLGPDERDAILDLARVAAHTSERIAAPLTTFVVGAALRQLDPSVRIERLRALAAALGPGT